MSAHLRLLLGHCIAIWYAMAWYLIKLMNFKTSCGHDDTVINKPQYIRIYVKKSFPPKCVIEVVFHIQPRSGI